MGLEINRDKTRVVNLQEKRAHLDFLGYTFRYDRDLKGRGHRYLNVTPSKTALQRERNQLRAMTGYSQSHKPLQRPRLVRDVGDQVGEGVVGLRIGERPQQFHPQRVKNLRRPRGRAPAPLAHACGLRQHCATCERGRVASYRRIGESGWRLRWLWYNDWSRCRARRDRLSEPCRGRPATENLLGRSLTSWCATHSFACWPEAKANACTR